MCFVRPERGVVALPLKVLYHVGDRGTALHATQFLADAFMPKPVAYRRTLLDRVESDSTGSEFLGHAGKRVRTLEINSRGGRKIDNDQPGRCGFVPDALQDRVANIVHVVIDQ